MQKHLFTYCQIIGNEVLDINRMSDGFMRKRKFAVNTSGIYRSICDSLLLQLHSQPKRRKSTINLNFGWMVFDETSSKFCQIRSPRGGGTRIMEMRLNSTYDDLLEIGKSTFFPNGIRLTFC